MPLAMLLPLGAILLGVGYSSYRIWMILPTMLWGKVLALGLWLLPMVLFIVMLLRPGLPLWLERTCYTLGSSWIFVMMYVVMAFLLLDLGRLIWPDLRPLLNASLSGTLGVALVITAIFIYGNAHYHSKVRVPLTIELDKPLYRELKVIGLSDLHLGYTIGRGELAQWVDMINAEKPDLILIAGDLVDGAIRPLMADSVYLELNRLQAPLGVYACLGNHEYIGGEADAEAFISRTGIRLLRDEAVLVDDSFYIVGRDDRTNAARQSIESLVSALDSTKPILVLDHRPYELERAEAAGVDFQLSGHTHRGQVFPVSLVVDQLYEISHGYLRKGGTQFYVSSGLGIWGGKFRIGTQSEYAVLTLKGKP